VSAPALRRARDPHRLDPCAVVQLEQVLDEAVRRGRARDDAKGSAVLCASMRSSSARRTPRTTAGRLAAMYGGGQKLAAYFLGTA